MLFRSNKSTIILKDLAYSPSDVNYTSLGGFELTAVMIDEAAEVPRMAYDILRSRIRYKLDKYKLIPKVLLTCNPSNNWIKKDFYLPYIQEQLQVNVAFVPALPQDNPHLPDSYIQMLKELPDQQRKRLLEGDWNYMDSADSLFNFDSIPASVFKFAPKPDDKKYISLDVARFGDDRSVAVVWNGLCITEIYVYKKLSATDLHLEIKSLMSSYGVHPNNVIVDSDGVGGPVSDMIKGLNFINNARALHEKNFSNLKSQCYVKLADMFKEGKISINITSNELVDELTQIGRAHV